LKDPPVVSSIPLQATRTEKAPHSVGRFHFCALRKRRFKVQRMNYAPMELRGAHVQ
jgi:hypothetical protein